MLPLMKNYQAENLQLLQHEIVLVWKHTIFHTNVSTLAVLYYHQLPFFYNFFFIVFLLLFLLLNSSVKLFCAHRFHFYFRIHLIYQAQAYELFYSHF